MAKKQRKSLYICAFPRFSFISFCCVFLCFLCCTSVAPAPFFGLVLHQMLHQNLSFLGLGSISKQASAAINIFSFNISIRYLKRRTLPQDAPSLFICICNFRRRHRIRCGIPMNSGPCDRELRCFRVHVPDHKIRRRHRLRPGNMLDSVRNGRFLPSPQRLQCLSAYVRLCRPARGWLLKARLFPEYDQAPHEAFL